MNKVEYEMSHLTKSFHLFSKCFAHRLIHNQLTSYQIAASLAAISPLTFAIDHTATDNAFLDDIPVVLTASRLSQPITQAPVAMTVIDKQMIRDSGAWELSEVMRLVPGMYVAYRADAFYSADSTVSYHGMVNPGLGLHPKTNSNRMQVLIDGRSVYSILFGSVNWSDLPITLQDIERIEVIRGPASSTYGSNSFAAVINIITLHPSEAQGTTISSTLGRGRNDGVMSYGGHSGDLAYRLTIAARRDEGLEDTIKSPALHSPSRKQYEFNKYDNKSIQIINWRGDYQISPRDSLDMQFGYNGGPRQAGEYGNFSTISKKAMNHSEQIRWRRALNNDGELSVQAYHNQERILAQFADSDGLSNGDAILRRYDLELQHTFSPSKDVRVVYGASTRYDKAYAPYYLGIETQYLFGDYGFHLNRMFANVEWRSCPELVFNLGGTREMNSMTGNDFTPRIAANWQFAPNHHLRAGYTRATRTPSIYEEAYNGFLRTAPYGLDPVIASKLPKITPKRVSTYEIGYLAKLGMASVDLRLFDERYTDLFAFGNVPLFSTYTLNGGEARVKGYEIQTKWLVSNSTKITYALSNGKSTSPNTNGVLYSDTMPSSIQSILISHQISQNWTSSLAAYQVSKTHFNEVNNLRDVKYGRNYYRPLTRRWDARVAYNFQLMQKNAELALNIQNLVGARYFEYNYTNELPGRQARLNFSLEL
jgi:iron complex outermembrane recepter protein